MDDGQQGRFGLHGASQHMWVVLRSAGSPAELDMGGQQMASEIHRRSYSGSKRSATSKKISRRATKGGLDLNFQNTCDSHPNMVHEGARFNTQITT